jgi:nicotinamidase-related amidase
MNETRRAPLARQDDSQLIIVDVQERLLGAMPAEGRGRTLRAISTFQQAAKILGVPVTVTEQYPKGLGATHGSIKLGFTPLTETLEKTGFSCCRAEGFVDRLLAQHRRQVVIAGIEAHVCVLQTALDLHAQGYEVFVAEDATCSRNADNHANAMHRLRQAGVIVTNSESVLFEWMGDAAHPHFKIVSGLLK